MSTVSRMHVARDHFLDLQESGGDWWLEGWRCINCGHVFDPVLERNRRLHAAALNSANVQPALSAQPMVEEDLSTRATSPPDARGSLSASSVYRASIVLIFSCFLVSPMDVGYTFHTFYGTGKI